MVPFFVFRVGRRVTVKSSRGLSRDGQIVEVNPVVGRDLRMAINAELEKGLEVVMHVGAVEHGGRLGHDIEKQPVTAIRVPRPGQAVPFAGFNEERPAIL